MNMQQHHFPFRCGSQQAFGSYLHQLSHDMRTPLNHIGGFAELLLLDEELGSVNGQYVEAILEGSEALKVAVVEHLRFMEAVMAAIHGATRIELQKLSELQIRSAA